MKPKTLGRWIAVLLSLTMAGALASPVAAISDDEAPTPPDEATGRYVVVMEDTPNVTEFGRDSVDSAAAEARSDQLIATHATAASRAGVQANAISYNYTTSLNGFAVELTDFQVGQMKNVDGVMMVLEDQMRFPQTDSSNNFLDLDGNNEAYDRGVTGEGVIIGVIDSGIWPEHPSFADDGSYSDLGIALDESVYPACDFGNTAHNADDAPFECNNKLIGARQILPTYRAVIGAAPDEFNSARDDDGHGTHTASTAGGNAGVDATVLATDVGEISGIAPRARIIAYKGLGNLGGFGSDLAAAIDQAVLDGVDVINYSVGGGTSVNLGPDDIAFLFAADAGVHVATSAGNSGPGEATIGGPAHVPWLTTVGASTQRRFFEGTVKYGSGSAKGASVTEGTAKLDLVDAEFAGGDLCLPGTLNPAVVSGNIVLCRRGAIARAAKGLAVAQAGGAGMILYNNDDVDNLITDTHWVPTVHIDNTPGVKIKQYIAGSSNPKARILNTGRETNWRNAPTMAVFSSRGPNPISADIIKPDITAPGVQIVAGHSPFPDAGSVPGQLFQAIQGTSMSSPHVAGHMALIKQVHPDWSAATVKSAIMTSAHQKVKDNDRTSQADPFSMGAGHIDPGRPQDKGSSFQPGLVYPADFFDYLGFICDAYPADINPNTCTSLEGIGIPTTAVNLNYPSIGVSELAGSVTVTRTVVSVLESGKSAKFTPKVDAPDGYEVTVSPKSLKLAPGEAGTYQVTITNVDAPIGEWRHGSITWIRGKHKVRSPISVRGTSLATPADVTGEGEAGSGSIPVRFGYTGDYTAAGHGLEPAVVFADSVNQDPDQNFDPSDVDAGGADRYDISVSGAAALLIAMPPDAVSDPSAIDLDIFVNDENGDLVASSTSGGTDESIILPLPGDGTYSVYVHGWQTAGPSADYELYTWQISATPGGNLVIDGQPAGATVGSTGDVNYSWSGAAAGEWHIGAISHSDANGLLALTLVDVDNRGLPS